MPREYNSTIDNLASWVTDAMKKEGDQTPEAAICGLLLGLNERLEALVDAVDGVRAELVTGPAIHCEHQASAIEEVAIAIRNLQGK